MGGLYSESRLSVRENRLKLIALTVLLVSISVLSLIAPSLWQGVALLLIVIILGMDSHLPPAKPTDRC